MDLNREDLLRHLDEQIFFMKASCTSYDSGMLMEFKRLALALRILLHDTKRQISLLSQLGVKDKLKFTNSSQLFVEDEGSNNSTKMGLVILETDENGIKYIPKIHAEDDSRFFVGMRISHFSFISHEGLSPEEIEEVGNKPSTEVHKNLFFENENTDFESWWNEKLMRGNNGDVITRGFAVLHTADKDGGAHVDKSLPEGYRKLLRSDTFGWSLFYASEPDKFTFGSPIPATIRQIAYEVLTTIENNHSMIYDS